MAADTPPASQNWLPRGAPQRLLLALAAAAVLMALFFLPRLFFRPAQPQSAEPPAQTASATAPAADTTPAPPEIIITGRIQAPADFELANARIVVVTRIPQVNDWRIYPDMDGNFRITGIPVGASGGIVFSERTDYVARAVWETNNWPAAQLPPGFTPGPGYIPFRALPAGNYDGLRVDFMQRATIKGVVTDETDKPVENVFVEGYGLFARTDDRGAYEAWVTPGSPIKLQITGADIVEDLALPDPITAQPGQVIERNFRTRHIVHPPHDKTITGRILTPDGKPAADVAVYLSNLGVVPEAILNTIDPTAASWQNEGEDPVVTHTHPDGSFVFDNLLPGHTDIWTRDGDNWAWSRQVDSGRQGLELKLSPQPAKIQYAGTVTDEQARPVAGAQLYLLNADERETRILAQAQSDDDGHYTLETTPAWERESYLRLVCLHTKDNVQLHVTWRRLPRMSADGLPIQFKPAASITGRVVDSSGKPVSNARVWVDEADSPEWSKMLLGDAPVFFSPLINTDAQGRYTLTGFPIGSMIVICARAPEFGEKYAWCTIADGAKAPDLILPPGISLAGTVRLPTGQPAPGATVTLSNLIRPIATATSDSQGRYRVGGLDTTQFYQQTFYVHATQSAGAAEVEGRARFNMQFDPGDDVATLDVMLHPSLAARQSAWRSAPAASPASRCHVLLLDSADLDANPATRHDLLTCLDSAGQELWHFAQFKDTWPEGLPHLMAVHPQDRSIWICQNAGNGLLKINADGTLAWSRPGINATLVAFDPQTSNAWIIGAGPDLRTQELLIVNPAGDILKRRMISANDLAFSPADSCFWILGNLLRRLDHDANITWESEKQFYQSALAIDPVDGTLWIADGGFSDAVGMEGHVLKLDRMGQVVKELTMPGYVWAVDAQRKHVWTTGENGELVRLNPDGAIECRVPLKPTSLALEPDTGNLWATCDQGLFRIDADGKYLSSQTAEKPTHTLVITSGP